MKSNKLKLYGVAVAVVMLGNPSVSQAMRGSVSRVDVSGGVVYPSDNSALTENAGALPSAVSTIEGLVGYQDPDVRADGSILGQTKAFGFGAGFTYFNSDNKLVYGGLGVGNHNFGVGLSGYYNIDSEDADADVGVQVGGRDGFGFGAVARSVTGGVDGYSFGVGLRRPMKYQLEVDLHYIPAGDLLPDDIIQLDPSVGFTFENRFTILAGYRFLVSPDVEAGDGDFRAGAALWLGRGVAIEYMYELTLAEHTAGLKIAL